MKYKINRESSYIRKYEDIAEDFLNYLIVEQKLIEESDRANYQTPEGRGELIELLVDKLYETEEINGSQCSTLNAFYCWCRFVVHHDPNTKGLVWNNLMKKLFLDIERHRFTAIMVSRGHGKSFFLGALYMTFKMWLVPKTQIAYISNVPQMTKRTVRLFKDVVKENEMLLEKMNPNGKGEKEFVWTQTELDYNDGFFETSTVGGQIRSAHVNFLFFDDLLRDDNTYTEQDYIKFVFDQAMPIVNRKHARMVLVGTPAHTKDIFHLCMNTKDDGSGQLITNGKYSAKEFYSVAYPMVLNWDQKELLLPETFEWKDVQRIIKVAGERSFWKEYMLVCTDASNRIFNDEIIAKSTSVDYKLEYNAKPNSIYNISADVATSGEASADSSAFIVTEIIKTDSGTKKIVRWIESMKGMPIKEQIDMLQNLSLRYNNGVVVVEKNNVGVALIQELQNRNVNVETFITTSQSKEGIIRYLVNEMTNGNLIIPFEGENCIKLRNELANFGIINTKSGNERMEALSGKDDLCMSLAINNYSCQMKNTGPSLALLY